MSKTSTNRAADTSTEVSMPTKLAPAVLCSYYHRELLVWTTSGTANQTREVQLQSAAVSSYSSDIEDEVCIGHHAS